MTTPEPELSPILARPPRTIPTWLFAVLAVTLLLGAGGAVQVVRSGSLFGFLVTVLGDGAGRVRRLVGLGLGSRHPGTEQAADQAGCRARCGVHGAGRCGLGRAGLRRG